MNLDEPQNNREALEARVTALLLGELTPAEAEAVQQAIAADAELGRLCETLKLTIGLVRETASERAAQTATQPAPLKLSEARREKLLAAFKTVAPKEFAKSKWQVRRSLVLAAAVVVLCGVLSSLLLPALSTAKNKAQSIAVLGNIRHEKLKSIDEVSGRTQVGGQIAHTDVPQGRAKGELSPAQEEKAKPYDFITSDSAHIPATAVPKANIVLPPTETSADTGTLALNGAGETDVEKGKLALGLPGAAPATPLTPRLQENFSRDSFSTAAPAQQAPTTQFGVDQNSTTTLAYKTEARDQNSTTTVSRGIIGRVGGSGGTGGSIPSVANAWDDKAKESAAYRIASDVPAAGSTASSEPQTFNWQAAGRGGIRGGGGIGGGGGGGFGGGGGIGGVSGRGENSIAATPPSVTLPVAAPNMGSTVTTTMSQSAAAASSEVAPAASTPGFTLADNPGSADARERAITRLRSPKDEAGQAQKVPTLGDVPLAGKSLFQTESAAANRAIAPPAAGRRGFILMGPIPAETPVAATSGLASTASTNMTFASGSVNSGTFKLSVDPDSGNVVSMGDRLAATNPSRVLKEIDSNTLSDLDVAQLDAARTPVQETMRRQARGVDTRKDSTAKASNQNSPFMQRLQQYQQNPTFGASSGEPGPSTNVYSAEVVGYVNNADVAPPKSPTPLPIPQPEIQTSNNAFSTFSLNVSDVSFKLAAASLEKGLMPDPGSIRSEEFINAFDYRDADPSPGSPIGFTFERASYPFAHNRDLLRFSVKTAAQGRQAGRPLNIVLLLDKSGSMERADRVEIIHQALGVLASQLQPQDTISVVVFARTARLWVDGLSGSQAGTIVDGLSSLTPEGGTNLEEAMKLAYETALRHYLPNGDNRVVLLTDGAANLGNVDPEILKQRVETDHKQGISLDCFGVGWEGYNDDLLEVLSRVGHGRYGFINTPTEAATEFAGQLAGALRVAASDVKVQVEFNPDRVTSYRQIGYAKHQLTKEQFRDNTVAAAEIGAAESGNALYTVEVNPAGTGPLCTVHVRYRVPGTSDYREQAWDVPYTGSAVALDQASAAMRLAATASAFSEWLATSPFAGEVTPDQLLNYLTGVPAIYGADARPGRLEWMIRQAKSISGK